MDEFESLPEFQSLVVAATGKPERHMGDSVIPAEPPQWSEVRTIALNLAKTTSDQLSLHIYLIQAEANVKGFEGFHKAMAATVDLLDNQWESMYPAPDLDDPDDMYYERVNLMNELSEQPMFLDALHRLPLVKVRGVGEFSSRDIEIAKGVREGSEEDVARCQEGLIRGAFSESDKEQLQTLSVALNALPDLCSAIESTFAEKTGQANVLSLERLKTRVGDCAWCFNEYAAEHLTPVVDHSSAGSDEAEALTTSEAAVTDPAAATLTSSTLQDRSMVTGTFDSILLYYQRYEPASPVRLLTARAKDLVNQPFFDLLQALAPNHRDDLPGMLAEVKKQPMAALISDSYTKFLSGETLPQISEPGAASMDVSEQKLEPVSINSGNSHAIPVIESREQVLIALQDIETYFLNSEPASPIPLVITDIRKLVSKRFGELVEEFSRVLPVQSAESSE